MLNWFRWKIRLLMVAALILFIIAAGIPIYVFSIKSNAVLISSAILGAMPLALFEFWDRLKSPYCTIDGVEVVKYPNAAYDIENEFENEFGNQLGIHVAVTNHGNEKAEMCTADLVETHTGKRFPTLWNKKARRRLQSLLHRTKHSRSTSPKSISRTETSYTTGRTTKTNT